MVKEPFAPCLFGPIWQMRSRTSTAWPFFFRPAKNPRTVCCAQPVASAICATVAPSGWRSISTNGIAVDLRKEGLGLVLRDMLLSGKEEAFA